MVNGLNSSGINYSKLLYLEFEEGRTWRPPLVALKRTRLNLFQRRNNSCNDYISSTNSLRLFFYLKVCDRSRSPQWNESFYYLVRDPREEMLIVKVSVCSVCVSRCSEEAFKGTSPPLTDIINVSLSAVVVKCMGPAYGISRSPCERAAL